MTDDPEIFTTEVVIEIDLSRWPKPPTPRKTNAQVAALLAGHLGDRPPELNAGLYDRVDAWAARNNAGGPPDWVIGWGRGALETGVWGSVSPRDQREMAEIVRAAHTDFEWRRGQIVKEWAECLQVVGAAFAEIRDACVQAMEVFDAALREVFTDLDDVDDDPVAVARARQQRARDARDRGLNRGKPWR